MKPLFPFSLLIVAFLAGCATPETTPEAAPAESHTESAKWTYQSETGPANWGTLSAEYATCGTGMAQSPIDLPLASANVTDLPALMFDYSATTLSLSDTGHGYKAAPDGSHTLSIGGDTYRLLQFHAHTPSEHTIEGESFPMEIHFVHQSEVGELAVVGMMIEEGDENSAFQTVIDGIRSGSMEAEVENPAALLPDSLAYFAYSGSLTTPPCTEDVRWNVLRESTSMSAEQIAVFAEAHGLTNRPVQPSNDRAISISR